MTPTDTRPTTATDRLADQLRRLAGRAHQLDRGTRLQVALVVEDALERTINNPQGGPRG